MESPVKTQVENGISRIFDLRGQTIDISDQAVSILKDSGLYDDEGKNTNGCDPLTADHSSSGRLFIS